MRFVERRTFGGGLGIRTLCGLAALVAIWPLPASAQVASPFHPDSSYAAESLLRNAARHVADKQWPEAIDLYLRVVEQHGNAVALVPSSDPNAPSQLYVNARAYCQKALAQLPADGLAQYRQRVDARAEQRFLAARSSADRAALRSIVDELFASRWGDQASELLGDLEFRAGRYREALAAYHLLVPDLNQAPGLVYPDPDIDQARVAAKILLCRAAAGDRPTPAEIEGFQRAQPDAKAPFAGREGSLADLVGSAIAEDDWREPVMAQSGWPTYAGASNRNGHVIEKVDVGSFQWKLELALPEAPRTGPDPDELRQFGNITRAPITQDNEPSVFPILVGDHVMIADESRVRSFHMNVRLEGSSEDEFNAKIVHWKSEYNPPFSPSAATRASSGQAVPRFTLTASGDRVFARLGATGRNTSGGILYAIRSNRDVEGKLIWRKSASDVVLPIERAGEHHVASFEGAPVADETRVYIAMTEATTDTWAYVACFDAETGQTLWVRHLGSSAPRFDPTRNMAQGPAIGNRMLSLQDGTLYYQTNLGALATLDAETGTVRWVATYGAPDRSLVHLSKRAPNPALVSDGLVIIAPEDAPGLYAFETATGRLVWKTDPIPELQYLLGSAKGKLFATGNHLYTFDIQTGRLLRSWPGSGNRFDGYGRGLLAGDFVYWPTRTEILVIDQETGGDQHATIPLFQSFGYGGGNLAAGDGYLVVAQRERLAVYCQNRRLLERMREQLLVAPERARDHFQLARLAEATGENDLALDTLAEVLKRAGPGDRLEGRPLREVALDKQHQLLLRLGDELGAKGQWPRAAERYEAASRLELSDRQHLSALLKLAAAHESAGQAAAAVATLQQILGNPRLSQLAVPVEPQRQVRVDLHLAERLAALTEKHGRAIYEEFDQRAEKLLQRGLREQNTPLLLELTRVYPSALAVPKALEGIAAIAKQRGELSTAISAVKRLNELATSDFQHAVLLGSLGQLYERKGMLSSARQTYLLAAKKYGNLTATFEANPEPVSEFVARRLAAIAARGSSSDTGRETEPGPLIRLASRDWDFHARPLVIEADSPDPNLPLVLANETRVVLWDLAKPKPRWSVDIGTEPTWAGLSGDVLLIGSNRRLLGLSPATGAILWRFDSLNAQTPERALSPFTRGGFALAPLEPDVAAPSHHRLHRFRLAGGRVFALRSDQALVAVDAANGRLLWMFSAQGEPLGQSQHPALNPYYIAGEDFVALEQTPANRLAVLNANSGALVSTLDRGEDQQPIARDPIALDGERVALVLDTRTIAVLNMQRGTLDWTFRNDSALPRAVPPLAWHNEETLLVLFGGQELARLDLDNGNRRWSRGIGLVDLSNAPDAALLDETHFFCVWDNTCQAFRVADGKPAWHRALLSRERNTNWSLGFSGPFLVVYPSQTRLADEGIASVTLHFCNRDTGAPVQRFSFQEPAERLSLTLGDAGATVATQSHGWRIGRKGTDPEP